jgi:hypothetical protein
LFGAHDQFNILTKPSTLKDLVDGDFYIRGNDRQVAFSSQLLNNRFDARENGRRNRVLSKKIEYDLGEFWNFI